METEGAAAPRAAVLDRVPAVPLLVGGVLLLVVVVRVWIADRIVTPWIMVDEIVYSELAKSIAANGDLSIREHASNVPSVLYPAAIAPAWLFDRIGTAYGIAKAINVVVMTSTIVPVWLWARRLAPPLLAGVTVVLVLVMPSMLYTGVLMTENAFLPLFVAACFCTALALERPTLGRQALVLGFCVLAIGVRLQGVVLLAVVPAAVALKLLFDRLAPEASWRGAFRTARPLWPTFAVLAAGALAFLVYEEARGRSLSSALGSYQAVATSGYSFATVRHWVVLHAAELAFSVGVVPASAFLVLLGLALLGRTATAAERSFVAVTTAAVVLVVVQVAAFASRFSLRIEERYLFPLAPLLFIALAAWIARGLPRPRVVAAIAAVVPVVLLLDVHLKNLLGQQILSDTFALIPVWRATQLLDGGTNTAQVLLWAGAAAAAAAFLFLPRRLALLLPAAVAVFLAVGSYPVFGAVRDYARTLQAYAGGGNLEWIDGAGRVPRRRAVPLRRLQGAGLRRYAALADGVLEPQPRPGDRARAARPRPDRRGRRHDRPGDGPDRRRRPRPARATPSRRRGSSSPATPLGDEVAAHAVPGASAASYRERGRRRLR